MTDLSLRRPVLRYHGGKWRIAPWVIQHFPSHRIYCEPYGGAGSVLMHKPRSFAEIYNDCDDEVVNVFRVLRVHSMAERLKTALELTPFSRTEFYASYAPMMVKDESSQIEAARQTIVRSFMGHGSSSRRAHRTGFRAKCYRSNSTGHADWCNYPDAIAAFTERLRGVCIENRDAIEVIKQQDSADTLRYIDPPYVHSTRTSHKTGADAAYMREMSDDDHADLSDVLNAAAGMVVLSGYESSIYSKFYKGWFTTSKKVMADGAKERIETLWISPKTVEKLQENMLSICRWKKI